jgi:DNA-binding ferritin-like protein
MTDREEVRRVVWHTPTEYDSLKHGPPYLPGVTYEPVKLSSNQRSEVRSFVKQASRPFMSEVTGAPLVSLLGVLQAVALLHQTHHWSTRGPVYYADHLLFERLYNESLEFIDQVAERAVGQGTPKISAITQVSKMQACLQALGSADDAQGMVEVSLAAELFCLNAVKIVLESSEVSPGTSNLLEGLADKHESFVYLLRQRSHGVVGYTYDRR